MHRQVFPRWLKWLSSVGMLAVALVVTAKNTSQYFERYWLEQAHQSLLTALVDARNHAWEQGVTVKVCLADDRYRCISVAGSSHLEGQAWMAYVDGEMGIAKPIAYYPYHAEYVAMTSANGSRMLLGFDAEGYSLGAEVRTFELRSQGGLTDKNYTVVVEPSGALQTLVNRQFSPPVLVAAKNSATTKSEG